MKRRSLKFQKKISPSKFLKYLKTKNQNIKRSSPKISLLDILRLPKKSIPFSDDDDDDDDDEKEEEKKEEDAREKLFRDLEKNSDELENGKISNEKYIKTLVLIQSKILRLNDLEKDSSFEKDKNEINKNDFTPVEKENLIEELKKKLYDEKMTNKKEVFEHIIAEADKLGVEITGDDADRLLGITMTDGKKLTTKLTKTKRKPSKKIKAKKSNVVSKRIKKKSSSKKTRRTIRKKSSYERKL